MWNHWRAVLLGSLLLAGCEPGHDHPPDPSVDSPSETGFFAEQVRPMLDAKCAACHGPRGPALGLVLGPAAQVGSAELVRALVRVPATAAPLSLVEPGEPARSWLYLKSTGGYQAVQCAGGCGGPMPPAGDPLTPAEVEVLRTWIANGAEVP